MTYNENRLLPIIVYSDGSWIEDVDYPIYQTEGLPKEVEEKREEFLTKYKSILEEIWKELE